MHVFVITAARTSDGRPVYLTGEANWSLDLEDALSFPFEKDATPSLAQARAQEARVCDPGLFKVSLLDGCLSPLGAKNRLRVEGPEVLLARLGYFDIPDPARRAARVGA
jgi:hypothetical protein